MNLEQKLNEEELALIHDSKDIVYLELIKGCSYDELKEFDKYGPINLSQYNKKQIEWYETDKYLLGKNLNHDPTTSEALTDYCDTTHNALRYRALYVLKYPHMVERK